MKERTRITAGIMIGLCGLGFVWGLIAMFLMSRHAPWNTPGTIHLEILPLLLNALCLAGWVYLLKGGSWAWTALVWLLAFRSAVEILSIISLVFPAYAFPWIMALGFFPLPGVSVVGLIMLLTDDPDAWKRRPIEVAPPLPLSGGPRKRTRVVAWIMLVWSAYGLLSVPFFFLSRHRLDLWAVVGMAGFTIAFPLWILLLRGRTWAWWGLTILYCGLALLVLYGVAFTPSYLLARGKTLGPIVAMTVVKLIAGSISMLPLFFLLTDRPGGWGKVSEAEG